MKQKESFKMKGHVRIIVDRADGTREVQDIENTIHANLQFAINNQLYASADDIRLVNPFVANETPPGTSPNLDGIVIQVDGGAWYSMISIVSEPTDTTTKIVGTLTGVADTFEEATVGHNHGEGDNDTFGVIFAQVASFDAVILAAPDTLTIEWTIDCAP